MEENDKKTDGAVMNEEKITRGKINAKTSEKKRRTTRFRRRRKEALEEKKKKKSSENDGKFVR